MIFKKYTPLLFAELYLLLTLLLLFYGPIQYRLHQKYLFYSYLFLYHLFTVIGYYLGTRIKIFNFKSEKSSNFLLKYWVITLLSLFSSLLSNSNLNMSNSLIPTNIFNLLTTGFNLETIGLGYSDKIQAIDTYQGNKLLNILFFFIAWPKVVYIPYIVYMWDNLNLFKKSLSLLISIIPVLSGISTGTNKPVFDFVLLFISSLLIYFILNKYFTKKFQFSKRKLFLMVSILGLFFSVYFFSKAMEGRSVDYYYLESTSVLGDITVKKDIYQNESSKNSNPGLVWLTNYVVQGYYGFSLSLEKDFTSTFGFGNSPFLMRQFEWLTKLDLRHKTYQYKIDNIWGETVQWHSFYSQMANDFHFIGVTFVLFFISFFMAITWKSIILYDNLFGKLLMPLYFILFVFMPANNQIFGYIETLSTFLILNILLFKTIKFSENAN